jgi:hypothetical protein
MGGGQAVSLDLPADQVVILRDRLTSWLAGIRDDLKKPERLDSPDEVRREGEVYERLLAGLRTGRIVVPDEVARAAIEAASSAYDKESNYAEVAANHDALRDLLTLLEGERA